MIEDDLLQDLPHNPRCGCRDCESDREMTKIIEDARKEIMDAFAAPSYALGKRQKN